LEINYITREFFVINRRCFLTSAAVLSVSGLVLSACSEEQQTTPDGQARKVPSQGMETYPLSDLMKEESYPDHTLGNPDAPIVMIEYASLTCGHCRNFHENTLPDLKANYIDTGKVYFIYRNFPIDPRALGAAMLASCVQKERYFNVLDALFERQREWATSSQPLDVLFTIISQAGLTREEFDACLSNQELQQKIQAEASRAREQFGVSSTPTLFINGRKIEGHRSPEEMDAILSPLMP
jgi:protein-disulfide isomerase